MAHIEVINGNTVLKDDWYIDDVMAECNWITEDAASHILEVIANSFDANIGINWEVIRYTAELLYPEDE